MIEVELPKTGYGPDDIEAASSGYMTKRVRQHIDARNQWATPITVFGSGRSNEYSLSHCYEAAIIATFVSHGFTINRARNAIARRMTDFYGGAGFVRDALAKFPNLPELQDVGNTWYWLVYPGGHLDNDARQNAVISTRAVKSDHSLEDVMSGAGFVVIIPVSEIVQKVNVTLSERMAKVEAAKNA